MSSPAQTRLTRRALLTGAASAAALTGCSYMPGWMGGSSKKPKAPPAANANALQPSAQLKRTMDDLALAWLRESPETATSLGVSEAQAGGPFEGRLSDYSAAGMQRAATIQRNTLAIVDKLDPAGFTPADNVTRDVVREAFNEWLGGAQFPWGRSGFGPPTPYVVNQIDCAFINVPSFLAAQHPIKNAQDVDAYLSRLNAFATVLDQETANVGADAGHGAVPPDFIIDGAVRELKELTGKKATENILIVSLKSRIGNAEGVDAAAGAKAVKDASAILSGKIVPALHRQIDALTKLRPNATHDAGIWRLKDGDKFYAVALRANTTSTMAPDDIHNLGLNLLKDFTSQMDEILKAQGMTRGTVAERIQALSKDTKQLYPNTDSGRAKLLEDLNQQIADLQPYLKASFGVLAKSPLEIKRVPPFKQAGSPGGYYESGSLDGSRPGYYYINLRDTAEWPKFSLPTLTYHEGEPGHHWQISIQQENTSLPFVRSALFGFSGYAEGWALYSEMLADEMGVYKDNPLGRLGYLQSAAFRATRLVVDTGMHSKQWSREKAIDFMVEALGRKKTAVTTEIERYCAWPGQACSYMIGRETIRGLRDQARGKLGGKFDIKSFHDVVLTNGSMPLSTLATVVNGWVAAQVSA